MTAQTLLVEIRTEELPPKALARMSRAFADGLRTELARDGLLLPSSAVRAYATPRRLAVQITEVMSVAADTMPTICRKVSGVVLYSLPE